ncbi:response regulator transcription factor [Mesorhizobium sp. B2-7-1]|uniref:response regulator n=1 Tax=Mesorhizobium sp. B2-7-1 TaxID=2589909 RepID=UPI00112A6A92|nr:response regulator transcription factor [Mesorhizobium sp. B2-7-1]TPJ58351.1 response regulator transcription factor [Mesorhizobium sp. B2-7-1]
MRVLLIEDDRVLGEAVRDHVAADGHAVDWSATLAEGREHLHVIAYELVLLDLHLPDGKGIEFLKALRRENNDTPVIILTARDQLSDRIEGLNSGADDYLVKPFDLGELSARLAAVARRYAGSPNPLIRLGPVEIDQARRVVVINGKETMLTSREWAVLDQFLRRPGITVGKAQIEDALYAFGAEIESNTVEVYVSRLRKKIGRNAITTVRGLGYRLAAP